VMATLWVLIVPIKICDQGLYIVCADCKYLDVVLGEVF
jgi:hypothetical protein